MLADIFAAMPLWIHAADICFDIIALRYARAITLR